MRQLALVVAGAFAIVSPAHANGVPEPTFAEKMALADQVVIGTVTRTDGPVIGGLGLGDTATLMVLNTLKGEAMDAIIVLTSSPVAELNPRCCDVGATYLMFLRRIPDGRYISVRGIYGMVRIGGPTNQERLLGDQ